jgi:hypothetical protein
MTAVHNAGPYICWGGVADNNPHTAPSVYFGGTILYDPRTYYGYQVGRAKLRGGWYNTSFVQSVNAIPMTKSATIIAAAQHAVSGTPLTLASSNVDGLAVVSGGITRADTGAQTSSVLKIDPLVASVTANLTLGSNIMTVTAVGGGGGHCYNQLCAGMVLTDATTAGNLPTGVTITGWNANQQGTGGGLLGTYLLSAAALATATGDTVTGLFTAGLSTIGFGPESSINVFNPGDMSSRTLLYTASSASGVGGPITTRGFDVYGYPITETVTIAPGTALTIAGTKAFKYVLSSTPGFTDATYNYSVGTNDVVGLPFRSDGFQLGGLPADVSLVFNAAAIAATTGYLAAVLLTPTASTGDPRGTYALQTASNGTLRLVAVQAPPIANVQTAIGLFGQPNYADF